MSEPRPVAPPDGVTQVWWDATREQRLLIQRCDACGHTQHYPRNLCTACGAADPGYVQASGDGTIYSWTIVRRGPHPAFEPPYVVALVRLDEGPTLLTNIAGDAEPRCDMRVRLAWEPLPDGRNLPVFVPAGD